MRIHILCNDGSPLGVTEASIYGEDGRMGVGGAELALLTLCKGWHDQGYKVTLYNNPEKLDGSTFEQLPMDAFSPGAPRDVLIIFRSPNMKIRDGASGLKVWWSCDQRTVNDFRAFAGMVDKVVTISPYHSQYFSDVYGIHNTIPIDLPVRTWEYEEKIRKFSYKCIWNSMPDRGVEVLANVWAKLSEKVPEASLVITSDWRLWTKAASVHHISRYRAIFAPLRNVSYTGAINRSELIKHEMEAQLNLATNTYEELFCISVAECEVAGAYPLSSNSGAIRTTNMGTIFPGNPMSAPWVNGYVDYAADLLQNQKKLRSRITRLKKKAKKRFSLDRILKEWEDKVFS